MGLKGLDGLEKIIIGLNPETGLETAFHRVGYAAPKIKHPESFMKNGLENYYSPVDESVKGWFSEGEILSYNEANNYLLQWYVRCK